jgi:ribosomal protein S18 acetylase RimI-like enzyme
VPDTKPPLLRPPDRLITRIKARGPIEIVDLATSRLKENLYSDDELIIFVKEPSEDPSSRDDLDFKRATADDAEMYARDIGTDSTRTFRGRLTERTRCYLIEAAGRLVHASWVTLSAAWTRELRAYVKPPLGDAYIYESFTRADARGRGVYPFALRQICNALALEAIDRAWVAVEADNPPSIRAVTKADFKEAFRITYGRRLGILTIQEPHGPMADIGRTFLNRQQ